MNPEQLHFDFMGDGDPCSMASTGNPPDDVEPSTDRRGASDPLPSSPSAQGHSLRPAV